MNRPSPLEKDQHSTTNPPGRDRRIDGRIDGRRPPNRQPSPTTGANVAPPRAKSAHSVPMPRHQRAWHARAKAPARLACPCQGTGALGMPVPRHRRAWHARAKAPARLACLCQGTNALGMPMPRHQRAWRAYAKAPHRPRQGTNTRALCPCQGTNACGVPLPRHHGVAGVEGAPHGSHSTVGPTGPNDKHLLPP
ncbi:hypothetical protein LWI28_023961 [Acer negundo]|uniref:Uncharacterized protein n=1 Tax=Acer negundo TaxID=4023 RepID=A0AAD5IXG4_ACENE|nr:hypothetical protein LWI28_023961 [Acer negundo]